MKRLATKLRFVYGSKPLPNRSTCQGWTFIELMVVIVLVAAAILIGTLSVYRGKAMANELTCQDNMKAIHSALEIYYSKPDPADPIRPRRTYPANQAGFEAFLQSTTYFPEGEPHCPLDDDHSRHYIYQYAPADPNNPAPGDVVITCSVIGSGHGSK